MMTRKCPWCNWYFAVTKRGKFYAHKRSNRGHLVEWIKCEGSGQPSDAKPET